MKTLLPFLLLPLLSLSLLAQSGVQRGTVDVRQYVQGSKSFPIHELFRFKDGERVLHA